VTLREAIDQELPEARRYVSNAVGHLETLCSAYINAEDREINPKSRKARIRALEAKIRALQAMILDPDAYPWSHDGVNATPTQQG